MSLGDMVLTPVTGSMTQVLSRGSDMYFNRGTPNQPPSPADLIKAYYSGTLFYTDLVKGLGFSGGISLTPGERHNADLAEYWLQVLDSCKPVPDITLSTEMWRQGWLNDGDYDKLLRRNGLFDPEVWQFMHQRSEQLSVGDILRLNAKGQVPEPLAKFLMDRVGFKDEQFQDFMLKESISLAPSEILDLANRGTIDKQQSIALLRANGLKNSLWQSYFLELRKQIPGPSDLVRFALREGWDQQVVDRFGYDADFPPEFQYWMDKQGYGWSEDVTTSDGTIIPGVPWPRLYWRAHWQQVAPGQAYEFLHRFRPDNIAQWNVQFPNLKPFTELDVASVLKIADYPQGFREYLTAASYRVLGRIDVRRMYAAGVIPGPFLNGRYMDMGYDEATAGLLADFTRKIANKPRQDKLIKCVVNMYAVGGITKEQAVQGQIDAGESATNADAAIVVSDTCKTVALLKSAISAIRKAYLRGETNETQARGRLSTIGITQEAANTYFRLWNIEFTPRRKQLSTAQVLDAFERGYITVLDAEARLANLGWDQPDRVILAAGAIRIIADRQAKAALAADRTKRAAAKEIERLAREAKAQHKAMIVELNRVEPLAMLKRLAKDGDITRDDYTAALKERDIPDEDVALWIEDTYDDNKP